MKTQNENSFSDLKDQKESAIKMIELAFNSIETSDFDEIIASIGQIIHSIFIRHFPNDEVRKSQLKGFLDVVEFAKRRDKREMKFEWCLKSYRLLLRNLIDEINTMGLPTKNDIPFDGSKHFK